MASHSILLYHAWSRPDETGAPLEVIEDRFPALFESRRLAYPRLADLADPVRFDQGIGGVLDHVVKRNFAAFATLAGTLTGRPVVEIERVSDTGAPARLDDGLLDGADTLILLSFDSLRTRMVPDTDEIAAVRRFLSRPDHLVCVCPHHDIGAPGGPDAPHPDDPLAAFLHHGDRAIPPRQQFGGFARALLAGLGVPVENRFGLRPAADPDGQPAPIEVDTACDRLALLAGVGTFNLHPHLPHLERIGAARTGLDVLARQRIDPTAPPHPFALSRPTFDALLQSRADTFPGTLLVGDATLWSSTAGGTDSLGRFWRNVVGRPDRSGGAS